MNFVQTLYVDKSKDVFNDSFGWTRPEFHLMSWALSCLQLNKLHKKVDLYANSAAAKILIDVIGLPYDDLFLEHDNLKLVDNRLWALPKILTYSLQDRPFLHIDGDVFLFDQFSDSLLSSQLIAQNLENGTFYYTKTQKQLMKYFSYFPNCVKADFDLSVPIKAVNAGILGGNNIPFIKAYASEAFEYISRNYNNLSNVDVDGFNVFFEQHLFYSMAKKENISINLLFSNVFNDNEYKQLDCFHEVPFSKTYLHLLGHYKKNEYTCLKMSAKLRELYPEYYYKIVTALKKQSVPLIHSFYYQEKLDSISEAKSFQSKAKDAYAKGISEFITNTEQSRNNFLEGNSDLILLTQLYNSHLETSVSQSEKLEFERDFISFTLEISNVLGVYTPEFNWYLYGRDIEAVNWYFEIFGDSSNSIDPVLMKSEGLNIVESEYDWSGVINKSKEAGVQYYSELELTRGCFFNLIIPEASQNKFSLFDIDEFDKIVLEHLEQPMSINSLLLVLQSYVDADVIDNSLAMYNNLIIDILKQLVIKKAIRPITENLV